MGTPRCATLFIAIAAAVTTLTSVQCGGKNTTTGPTGGTPTPSVSSLSVAPSSVGAGGSLQGTVVLTAAAPSGANVTLTSSNQSVATVPQSVAIASGSSSAAFTVNAVGAGTATITGSFNNSQAS